MRTKAFEQCFGNLIHYPWYLYVRSNNSQCLQMPNPTGRTKHNTVKMVTDRQAKSSVYLTNIQLHTEKGYRLTELTLHIDIAEESAGQAPLAGSRTGTSTIRGT